jgi:hypothetical protein
MDTANQILKLLKSTGFVLMNITHRLQMNGLPANGMDLVSPKKSALSSSGILSLKIARTHGARKPMNSFCAKKTIGLSITPRKRLRLKL